MQMLKNRGHALALVALFAVAVYGVPLSSHEPIHDKKISSSDQTAPQKIPPESPEDRVADYTEVLAWFTAILALVSSAQIAFLFRADKTSRISANAAKQSADSLRNIERAYVFIDYELLRERNTALKEGGIRNKQIALVFKNFGRTPAIVNGINYKCLYWQNRYLPEMKADRKEIPSGIAIGSGSPRDFPAFFEGTQCHINEAMSGAGSIYLYGEIAYLDMLGEQRETGFCCEWNFAEGQFFMAPDTKLNYYT
jgi:hypothetical protein